MIKAHLLGTASGVLTEKYPKAGSTALEVDGRVYLFDCGESCSVSLLENGLNYNKITTIFISHMHPDHTSGVFQLVQQMVLLSKRKDKLVFCLPEEAVSTTKKFLEANYYIKEALSFPLLFRPIKRGFLYRDKIAKITAIPNRHLHMKYILSASDRYPAIKMQSFSFLVEVKGKKMVYSGDIRAISDLNPFLEANTVDLLVLELSHLSMQDVDSVCRQRVRKIALTHIHHETDRAKLADFCRREFEGRVIVAGDGLKIEI